MPVCEVLRGPVRIASQIVTVGVLLNTAANWGILRILPGAVIRFVQHQSTRGGGELRVIESGRCDVIVVVPDTVVEHIGLVWIMCVRVIRALEYIYRLSIWIEHVAPAAIIGVITCSRRKYARPMAVVVLHVLDERQANLFVVRRAGDLPSLLSRLRENGE